MFKLKRRPNYVIKSFVHINYNKIINISIQFWIYNSRLVAESIITATLVKLQADGFYRICFFVVQPAWPEACGIRYLWI